MSARMGKRLAALALLAVLASLVLVEHLSRGRLGGVRFTTDGPVTVLRITSAEGRTTGPIVAAPTLEPVPLAEGTYDLVATRPGVPALSARFDVTRGRIVTHPLDLSVGRMGAMVPIDRGRGDRFGFVDFGTRRDLLVARGNGSGTARHDLAADRVVWDVRADDRSSDALIAVDPLPKAKRLDADDEPDVIWGNATNLVAMSGRTGLLLWSIRPDDPAQLAGPACWVGDIDNDGSEDLAWQGSGDPASGFVEARSGRDGHRLWQADLPAPPDESIPLSIVHRQGGPLVLASSKAWLVALEAGDGRPAFGPTALPFAPGGASRGTDRDGDGTDDHLILHDLMQWGVVSARDGTLIGRGSAAPGQVADVPRWLDANRLLTFASDPHRQGQVTVVAPTAGALAWRFPAAAPGLASGVGAYDTIDVNGDRTRDAIIVRRGLGRALGRGAPVSIDRPGSGPGGTDVVESLDGTNGTVLWSRPIRVATEMPSHLIAGLDGSDLDGDGVPEVFVASIGSGGRDPIDPQRQRHSCFVEAFSGASGRPLWRWQGGLLEGSLIPIATLRWRASGPGRHPDLVVRIGPYPGMPPDPFPAHTWVLRPEDGALIQEFPGTPDVSLLDVDKDGVDDLVIEPTPRQMIPDGVTADRGHPLVAWRRLGRWHRTPDLDGDRSDDAYTLIQRDNEGQSLRALSLRDGRILWEVFLPEFHSDVIRGEDGDGDGIAEFLAPKHNDFIPEIVSGRAGRLLGASEAPVADRLRESLRGRRVSLSELVEDRPTGLPSMVDGDGDGVAELLVWCHRFRSPTAAGEDFSNKAVVAAVDARSGEVRWQAPLVAVPGQVRIFVRGRSAELDGMPGVDLLTLCRDDATPARYRVAALRGRDGSELWSRPAAKVVEWPARFGCRAPDLIAADLDGDGIDEVVLVDRVEDPDAPTPADPDGPNRGNTPLAAGWLEVKAWEGRDGAERWSWRGPDSPAVVVDARAHGWTVRLRASRGPILWVDQAEVDPARPQQVSVRQFRIDARGQLIDERAGVLTYPDWSPRRAGLDPTRNPGSIVALDRAGMAVGPWAAADLDGDGNDEVARYDVSAGRLETFSGEGPARPGPTLPLDAVKELHLDILEDRPAVVVVPWPDLEVPKGPAPAYDLATGEPLGPPGRARQTLPGGPPGSNRHLTVAPDMIWVEESGDVPASQGPSGRDPRLARPLPWADWPMIRYVVGSVPFALVLLALPAWASMRTVRTRSLRWAFVAVAAIALAVAAYRQRWLPIEVEEDLLVPQWRAAQVVGMAFVPVHRITGARLDPRWVRAAVGLPLVALLPAAWAWRRHRGRALVAFGLATALIAPAWWALDRQTANPSEYFIPEDWHLIGFWDAYAFGVAAIVASVRVPRRRDREMAS